jgi:hypothetical protein
MQAVPQPIERDSSMKTIRVNLQGEKIRTMKSRFFSKAAIATLIDVLRNKAKEGNVSWKT